jgi:hypothetical protein
MFRIFIIVTLAFSFSLVSALSFSGNGGGTEEDPYQITTVEQLQEMNDDLGAHYILMNDIDASETREWNVGDHDNDPETPDSAMGFEPIGIYERDNPAVSFTGSLDGQSFSVLNLYIYRIAQHDIGFLGCISDSGYVHRVNVRDAYVSGNNDVGSFVGTVLSDVVIEDCRCSGIAIGNSDVGGFCGYNSTNIINCYSSSDVVGKSNYVGGFCGILIIGKIQDSHCSGVVEGKGNYIGGFCGGNAGNIFNCYSSGDASGNERIGGFCGGNSSSISYCHSSGNATGKNKAVAGFCGENIRGDISNCYSSGDAIGNGNYVAGFCGWKDGGSFSNCFCSGNASGYYSIGGFCGSNHGDLINCNSSGDVKGIKFIGGLCGQNYGGTIVDSYCTGNVTGSEDFIGGFSGWNAGSIDNCYCSGNIVGSETVGGFTGGNNSYGAASIIKNAFCTGNVSGTGDFVGGFCGCNDSQSGSSTIINCYSTGIVAGETNYTGGFCGSNDSYEGVSEITSCYWDTQTSGITESDGGEGKSTSEMKSQSTFENWDFDNIWCIVEGKTYPQLHYFVDCDTLVSVPDTELNSEIRLYPNPTDNALYISFDSGLIHSPEIAIYNQLGQVVFSDSSADMTQQYKVNTGNFPPGIYFCKVSGNGISEVRSFVVYR